MTVYYKDGFKYQIEENWFWVLSDEMAAHCEFEYSGRYYSLEKFYFDEKYHWKITAFVGCATDGVTMFPDSKYLFEGSVGHDILTWLIEKGVIPESANSEIDRELGRIILARAPIPKIGGERTLKIIAASAVKLTHLVKAYKDNHKELKSVGRHN